MAQTVHAIKKNFIAWPVTVRYWRAIMVFVIVMCSACQTAPVSLTDKPTDTHKPTDADKPKPDFTLGKNQSSAQTANPQVQRWIKMAQTELSINKPDRALDLLDRAVRIEPRNAEVWLGYAKVYVQLQKLDRAKQMARKAITLAAGNESIQSQAKAIVDIIY